MKIKKLMFFAVIITALLASCGNNNSANQQKEQNLDKNASYALGMSIGSEFLESMVSGQISPDTDEFIKGMSDVMKGKNTRLEFNEAMELLEKAFTSLMEKRNEGAQKEENAFLAENAKKPGINITQSGLQYEIIKQGTGPKPNADDMVKVHYEGALIDGTVFDSSYSYGSPLEFYLFQVIEGWSEGLQLMNVGSHYRFYIPSELGYGPNGRSPIPPYAALIFDVELLEIIEVNE
ncbi:MAG: FKBP-type peptidyl-prolyl cis-trans isomerase [Treponema sp.]|nr:FKBP-type peptidyl-prolyl cis-trans isomerase [Treponema sp.]